MTHLDIRSGARFSPGSRLRWTTMMAAFILLALPAASRSLRPEPIRLHPENPHYFLWRGKTTVLVASTEHYGAVLNADFDYRRYLDELKTKGLNYTRIFSGVYCEPWGEPFNTLNPPKGRLLAPWARSGTPGYVDGGNQFDLDRWDDAYFHRLRDFLSEAGKRGVVVEITLFCNWYDANQWRLSPLFADNNVNGVGNIGFEAVNTLRNGDFLKRQEAMVCKIVSEVNRFDNLFFEICNEPGAEGAWMDHMARLVYDTESALPNRHLIANNFHVTPHLSILNAHYDRDTSFVRGNYARGVVIGYDETGFDGADDRPYRRQGWRFLLSGGGLYDNLDWSFSVAHPAGSETKWDRNLGGGSSVLRLQLGILRAFLSRFNLPRMTPDSSVLRDIAPDSAVALVETGRQYAIYREGGERTPLTVSLPAGRYRTEWVGTKTGQVEKSEAFRHAGGGRALEPPPYTEDIALRILGTGRARAPQAASRTARTVDGWTFYRGVNLGGPALTIDGLRWEAGSAPGVSVSGGAFEDQAIALHPSTDAGRAAMIRSSVWDSQGSNVTLSGLPAGAYRVYLYVWEDNVSQTFDIAVNGARVRRGYSSGAAGHWERLGPWETTATGGRIEVRCSPGDANLSGIEVWRKAAAAPKRKAAKAMDTDMTAPAQASHRARAEPALRVSGNGRYLVRQDGKPFFWLGDTAWLLFQTTSREDADLYLRTRARQGFTVVQAGLMMGGTLQPNVYGDRPFTEDDPARPAVTPGKDPARSGEYDFWDHADYIIERAAAHRLMLGVLPLFIGYGGEGYRFLTPQKAYAYGLFLGRRYGSRPHVFWILGGDNTPDTEVKQKVWHEMARGITVGACGAEDYARTLMTYHINGGSSSSQWFHTAPWLDFNMNQVWGDEKGIYPQVARDYGLTPIKPTGLGEGSYEDGPQYPTRPIDALNIRKQAYWAFMAGGYYTYGNTNVWNFGTYRPEATQDWKAALNTPGAASLSVLARLLTGLEWWKLAPDRSVLAAGEGGDLTRNAAMRSTDGKRLLVYLSHPGAVTLRLARLTGGRTARATWADPRSGTRTAAGDFPATGERAFTPPEGWPDALLIVEAR